MAANVVQRPIHVWQAAWGGGMRHIITYGEDYQPWTSVHVLWSGAHYDALLPKAAPQQQPTSKL